MARKVSMLTPHRAILSNGDTIEYEGAHFTHWTTGGVDANGQRNGTPVQTFAVISIIPGTWPEDDIDVDPRDAEIERLRAAIADMRSKDDPKDSLLSKLRQDVDALVGEKGKDTTATLTPEEQRANDDALTEYKSGVVNG